MKDVDFCDVLNLYMLKWQFDMQINKRYTECQQKSFLFSESASELCSSVQVISFNSGQVGFGQNEFTKRVGFSVAMPSANISFHINNTQESDSGLYVCIVLIPGGPAISGQVQLNVKGNEKNILNSCV